MKHNSIVELLRKIKECNETLVLLQNDFRNASILTAAMIIIAGICPIIAAFCTF